MREAPSQVLTNPTKIHDEGKDMHVIIEIDLEKFECGYNKLAQLEALLTSTSGPGFTPFNSMAPDYQDQLIMLAADLAHEARNGLTIL